MATDPVIRIDGLTIRYGSFVAVNDLHLEVRKGELFGLLGPNGAGKSSTIKVLIGQRKPTSGRVSVFGHDVVQGANEVRRLLGRPKEVWYFPARDEEAWTWRYLEVNYRFFNVLFDRSDGTVRTVLRLDEVFLPGGRGRR